MTRSLEGRVTLVTPPEMPSGGSGAIRSIDLLWWNGNSGVDGDISWNITVADGGEILVAQAFWQPPFAVGDETIQSSFWTDNMGFSSFDAQPIVVSDPATVRDGDRVFQQEYLTGDGGDGIFEPYAPFLAGPDVLHFYNQSGNPPAEFYGWLLHIDPASWTGIENLEV